MALFISYANVTDSSSHQEFRTSFKKHSFKFNYILSFIPRPKHTTQRLLEMSAKERPSDSRPSHPLSSLHIQSLLGHDVHNSIQHDTPQNIAHILIQNLNSKSAYSTFLLLKSILVERQHHRSDAALCVALTLKALHYASRRRMSSVRVNVKETETETETKQNKKQSCLMAFLTRDVDFLVKIVRKLKLPVSNLTKDIIGSFLMQEMKFFIHVEEKETFNSNTGWFVTSEDCKNVNRVVTVFEVGEQYGTQFVADPRWKDTALKYIELTLKSHSPQILSFLKSFPSLKFHIYHSLVFKNKLLPQGNLLVAESYCEWSGNDRYQDEKFVERLPRGTLRAAIIQAYLDRDNLKHAGRMASHSSFPVHEFFDAETAARLLGKEKLVDVLDQDQNELDAIPHKTTSTNYFRMPSHVRIHFADQISWNADLLRDFQQCMAKAQTSGKSVGLDAEWKPLRRTNKAKPFVALLQVAFSDDVFLFDLMVSSAEKKYWSSIDDILSTLFHSAAILKTGYAFSHDIDSLHHSHPALECFKWITGLIELDRVAKKFIETEENGLSGLTNHLLGRPLCKLLQCSDWEQRPLMNDQVLYSSLDAWVLPLLKNKMNQVITKVEGWRSMAIVKIASKNRTNESCDSEFQSKFAPFGCIEVQLYLKALDYDPDKFIKHKDKASIISNTQDVTIARSICFVSKGHQPVLVLTDHEKKIDVNVLSDALGVNKKYVRLASSNECVDIFGFVPGTMTPFALRNPGIIQVYLDEILKQYKYIYPSGGSEGSSVLIKVEDLVYVTKGKWLHSISESESLIIRSNEDDCWTNTNSVLDPKFLVDCMMGKLARKLRLLGKDTEYIERKDLNRCIEIARSENRVILTRDLNLVSKARKLQLNCYLIQGHDTQSQMIEIITKFSLSLHPDQYLSRCAKCNCNQFLEVEKEAVKESVAVKTYDTFSLFWICKNCKQVFWKGSHYDRANRMLDKFVESIKS